jgi:hypothetical protein
MVLDGISVLNRDWQLSAPRDYAISAKRAKASGDGPRSVDPAQTFERREGVSSNNCKGPVSAKVQHRCQWACRLILCGREFRLSVRELGGQLIDSPAQLLSLSAIGARRVRGRAAVRLLKLLEQGGRRFRGTLLRLW